MAATTTRLVLPYPGPDDSVDPPRDIKALAEKLDTVVAVPDAGDLKFSARKAEHGNWIKADGRALASGVYPVLRAALIADGSPFGADAGNPRLPNMADGRAPVGAGTGYPHGAGGGEATHALALAEMPAHGHQVIIAGSSPGGLQALAIWNNNGRAYSAVTSPDLAAWIKSAGSGTAHNNMPPYTVGQWFIYAG